jgi:hypothetical protein
MTPGVVDLARTEPLPTLLLVSGFCCYSSNLRGPIPLTSSRLVISITKPGDGNHVNASHTLVDCSATNSGIGCRLFQIRSSFKGNAEKRVVRFCQIQSSE